MLPEGLRSQSGPVLVVAFHGTSDHLDWLTNVEVPPASLTAGLPFYLKIPEGVSFVWEGELHSGFFRKYLSMSREMIQRIQDQLQGLSDESFSKLKVYTVGHSQGAALAQIATLHLFQFFQEEFQWFSPNQIQGWFFAAPPVADKVAKNDIQEKIGRNNLIRQNVRFDLVPNYAKFLKNIAMLASLGSTYQSLGVLVYQDAAPGFLAALKIGWKKIFAKTIRSMIKGDIYSAMHYFIRHSAEVLALSPHMVNIDGFHPDFVHLTPNQMVNDLYQG